MQQLGCSWGKINEKKLTEKKLLWTGYNYYWLLALKVCLILGGVRCSIQNINLDCLKYTTVHELADKIRMSVKVGCS